jgi:hypothetical protein
MEVIPALRYEGHQETPIRSRWLVVAGAVGFLGSIASITSLMIDLGPFERIGEIPLLGHPLVLGMSVMLLILGIGLRGADRPLTFGSRALYLDRDDRIHVAAITGACPIKACDGKLQVATLKEGDREVKKLICTRFPERHQFPFYTSELPPVS